MSRERCHRPHPVSGAAKVRMRCLLMPEDVFCMRVRNTHTRREAWAPAMRTRVSSERDMVAAEGGTRKFAPV